MADKITCQSEDQEECSQTVHLKASMTIPPGVDDTIACHLQAPHVLDIPSTHWLDQKALFFTLHTPHPVSSIVSVDVVHELALYKADTGRCVREAYERLHELYQGIVASEESVMDRAAAASKYGSRALTYGELPFFSVMRVLDMVPNGGTSFVDLGSGAGALCMAAYMCGRFTHVTGIELLPRLHQCAIKAQNRLEQMNTSRAQLGNGCITFTCADVFESDWSDKDVVFANLLCFPEGLTSELMRRVHRLRQGAVFLSTRPLTTGDRSAASLDLIAQQELAATWGTCTVQCYQRQ